ncbi:malto-oligosyltrehalose synthase, partial [Paenarthrobacter sp. RAF9]
LNSLDARLRGSDAPADYHAMIRGTKRRIADGILRSEILRLARLIPESLELPHGKVADALAEVICCFPIYRTYLPYGAKVLSQSIEEAARHRPDLDTVLRRLEPLLLDESGPLARRFQQTSGMVMAKGVEDTAFFRYTRLGTLTEVGADPTEFSIPAGVFHERMARRQQLLPLSMTTLSTHDTKRSEDARARISAISEAVPEWELFLGTVQQLAPIPDGPLAALIWQSIVGAWPADRGRLQSYALKAAREAGNSTNWTDPNAEFERHLAAAVDAAFDVPEVAAALDNFVAELEPFGTTNSLSAKLVQLTMPGVPDVYQGTEFRDGSLTDPDNRRPVDFKARIAALAELDAGAKPAFTEESAKLLVLSRALRLRRDRPELFVGYLPVAARGPAAGHVVAFDRGTEKRGALTVATRLPRRLERDGGWRDTVIDLTVDSIDQLTGASYSAGAVPVARLLQRYPVALLVPAT